MPPGDKIAVKLIRITLLALLTRNILLETNR